MGCSPSAMIGKFDDPHESPPSSEEEGAKRDPERDLLFPKAHNQMKQKKPGFGSAGRWAMDKVRSVSGNDAVAKFWAPYLTTVTVEEKLQGGDVSRQTCDALVAVRASLVPGMIQKVTAYPKLHTIEIISCKLDQVPPNLCDLENLCVLRLSHNHINQFPISLVKGKTGVAKSNLEKVMIDNNKLSAVAQGLFWDTSGENDSGVLGKLQVLNLAHNQLRDLPDDFAKGCEKLKYMDMSFNSLYYVPDTVMSCKFLQLLFLSHNQLVSLPEEIYLLTHLRKLFVSYNELKALPERIGSCRKLEKIRVAFNNIHVMPDSCLKLWNSPESKDRNSPHYKHEDERGCLEEFWVDGNPLVQPSITAFTMGGLNQAFQLFKEWVEWRVEEEKKAAERERLFREAKAAEEERKRLEAEAEENDGEVKAIEAPRAAAGGSGQPAVPAETPAAAVPASAAKPRTTHMSGTSEEAAPTAPAAPAHAAHTTQPAPDVHDGNAKNPLASEDQANNDYYFKHCAGDGTKIAEIRSAESTLLLLKKNMFVDHQIEMARDKEKEDPAEGGGAENLTDEEKEFLQDDFDVTKYKQPVHVTDLDLYFNLLVFSTKPLYSSCQILFDKFCKSTDPEMAEYLKKEEWTELCTRVPVKLPPAVAIQMWELLSWRCRGNTGGEIPDTIKLCDFVAGWHVHDVTNPDTWIKRITDVLRLEYYEMDIGELNERLKSKSAQDATPQLDFDVESNADSDGIVGGDGPVHLPMLEGDRLNPTTKHKPDALSSRKATQDEVKRVPKISLTAQEFSLLEAENNDGSDGSVSEISLQSEALSDDSDSSLSDFDAQDWLKERHKLLQAQEAEEARQAASKDKLVVNSAADLEKLMMMPVAEISPANDQPTGLMVSQAEMKPRRFRKKRVLVNKQNLRDPSFRTDVFTVRIAMREAYRNMPHEDFGKLINFVLRGMKLMKHYGDGGKGGMCTYWHCDDPTFRYTMGGDSGMNAYARQLLSQCGFVCIREIYWVWPEKHLRLLEPGTWAARMVPQSCPGTDKMRIDDMIHLFKACQRDWIKSGSGFTGHTTSKA